jgi:DNA-binding transcriptional MocR family regulator
LTCARQRFSWLPDAIPDEWVFTEAHKVGVEVLPISRFYIGKPDRSGIILGYTAACDADITRGVQTLRGVLLRQRMSNK